MDKTLKALSLTEAEKQALNELIIYLRSEWPQVRVLAYGSKVKGIPDEESDLDFLVILPCFVDEEIRHRIIHKVFELNLTFGSNISALIVSREEWETGPITTLPIHDIIEEEGIVL